MLILASISPRRKELLSQITTKFVIKPSPYKEQHNLNLPPKLLAEYLATQKALAVAKNHVFDTVIGADTIVEKDGKILGKPKSEKEAEQMLQLLSNSVHFVHTGICIVKEGNINSQVVTSLVKFKNLSQKDISDYIATGSPFDKAGAYGVQDSNFVEYVDGSFTNVVGFPQDEIEQMLKELEVLNNG